MGIFNTYALLIGLLAIMAQRVRLKIVYYLTAIIFPGAVFLALYLPGIIEIEVYNFLVVYAIINIALSVFYIVYLGRSQLKHILFGLAITALVTFVSLLEFEKQTKMEQRHTLELINRVFSSPDSKRISSLDSSILRNYKVALENNETLPDESISRIDSICIKYR